MSTHNNAHDRTHASTHRRSVVHSKTTKSNRQTDCWWSASRSAAAAAAAVAGELVVIILRGRRLQRRLRSTAARSFLPHCHRVLQQASYLPHLPDSPTVSLSVCLSVCLHHWFSLLLRTPPCCFTLSRTSASFHWLTTTFLHWSISSCITRHCSQLCHKMQSILIYFSSCVIIFSHFSWFELANHWSFL